MHSTEGRAGVSVRHPASFAVAAVIALQVTVPTLAMLVGELPTRFGFQMYSAQGFVEIKVLDANGAPVEIDLERVIAGQLRPEFDWTEGLPPRICTDFPDAAVVSVRQPEREATLHCD